MLTLAAAAAAAAAPPLRPNPNSAPLLRARFLQAVLPPPLSSAPPWPRPLPWHSPPRRLGLLAGAGASANGTGETTESAAAEAADSAADELWGRSTLPERFRYLTKEAPERPVWWPWFIAVAFGIYAWRTVLWELTNWKKAAVAILQFIGYLSKLALAFLYQYIGDPITALIRCIEFSLYNVRYFYGSIVAFAPVPELMRIIFFSSTVVAIAEATVPDPVKSQPYLLAFAGIFAFGAVKGFVPELLFWFLLAAFFCYSRFIKKRDNVSSALPSVAVFAAVGEPWVRALAIGLYLALAITQYSETSEGIVSAEAPLNGGRTPTPLLLAALAIGIHVAAKWVRRRHLTWMIA